MYRSDIIGITYISARVLSNFFNKSSKKVNASQSQALYRFFSASFIKSKIQQHEYLI